MKQRARVARYQRTAKGRAAKKSASQHYNARRVYVGYEFLYAAPTVSEARAVNAHIKGRRLEFRQKQRREKAESFSSGAVLAEATV